MAEPAFSASGFTILSSETVEVRGQSLDRFLMEKRLASRRDITTPEE
jgi:hypothetical protein